MDRYRAKVIAPQGNSALTVEWIPTNVDGQVTIGGPNFNSIPVDAVPLSLRQPHSEFWVQLSSDHEFEAVQAIDE